MNLSFVVLISSYAFTHSVNTNNNVYQNKFIHELTGTRKLDLISGNDMRCLQDKQFDFYKYQDNVKNINELLKIKVTFQDRYFLSNVYAKDSIKTTRLTMGGLFDDFLDYNHWSK